LEPIESIEMIARPKHKHPKHKTIAATASTGAVRKRWMRL